MEGQGGAARCALRAWKEGEGEGARGARSPQRVLPHGLRGLGVADARLNGAPLEQGAVRDEQVQHAKRLHRQHRAAAAAGCCGAQLAKRGTSSQDTAAAPGRARALCLGACFAGGGPPSSVSVWCTAAAAALAGLAHVHDCLPFLAVRRLTRPAAPGPPPRRPNLPTRKLRKGRCAPADGAPRSAPTRPTSCAA